MLKERSNAWGLACVAVALVLLALYSARTYGLNTEKPAKPDVSPRRNPPAGEDREAAAYAGISRIADPGRRLEALKAFIAGFPASNRLGTAQNQILDTLIRHFPDRVDEIAARARMMIEEAPERGTARRPESKPTAATRDFVCNTIATRLLDAGILLDQAEAIARLGLSLLDDSKEPAEREPSRRFQKMWAGRNATLGQICLKEGKLDEADRVFKRSFKIDPTLVSAAVGLGELAERKGRYDQALDYFAAAAVTGKSSEGARKQLDSVYARLHNGSLDGLEEMLDAVYRREFPAPIRVERYKAGPARTRRVVLAEVFTGSGCPSCVAADLAFEAAMQRYSVLDLALLMYHVPIPQPDPMTNPSTVSRSKFYSVRAVPSTFIDGAPDGRGGGSREDSKEVYQRINPGIERRLEVAPGARIALEAFWKGQEIHVKAAVDQVRSASSSLRLQLALVEDELRYTGENGIRLHPMVVRSLAGQTGPDPDETYRGFVVAPARPASVEYTFDLTRVTADLNIDPDRLLVVAFVQDESTGEVLQASAPVTPRY